MAFPIKKIFSNALLAFGINKVFYSLTKRWHKPVILCYHRISYEQFDNHIAFLKTSSNIIPLNTLLDNIYSATKISKPAISITMDDCYSKEFANAYAICQKYETPCTYFVPTYYSENGVSLWPLRIINFIKNSSTPFECFDFKGERVKLDTDELKKKFETHWINKFSDDDTQTADIEKAIDNFFIANNFKDTADPVIGEAVLLETAQNPYTSFQSHSVTHPKLYLANNKNIEEELIASNKYLEKYSKGQEQYVFCYPYGSARHIGNSEEIVKKHYKYAVTLQSGVVTAKCNPHQLPRIGIYEHDTPQSIALKIMATQLKHLLKK